MLIGPSIDSARSQLTSRNDAKNYHIVDRINMDFMIETCIIAKGSDLTKLRITGKLPVLHASISDAKYKSLMKLLEVAIPKFDQDNPDQAKQAQKQKRRSIGSSAALTKSESNKADQSALTTRPKSFQFSNQEHELVMEEEDDHEDDTAQTFKDAKQGHDDSQASLHQRSFEFNFVVEKLQGSLYKSSTTGDSGDQLLAEMIAESFSLAFYQRKFDMTAEVSLKTLVLEDHVEQSPSAEFKNIISSEDHSTKDADDLFKLKFVRVNRESPEFMPTFEGIGTNLDVAVSTINLVVTRKTLLTLLDFVLVTFASGDSNQQEAKVQDIDDDSIVSDDATKQSTKPNEDRIRIKAELKTISMILNNDGIRLATLSLNTSSVGLTLMGKTMRLGARLGNLSLIDALGSGFARNDITLDVLRALTGMGPAAMIPASVSRGCCSLFLRA